MKYNPKINEKVASLPGFIQTHPLAPEELVQGNLELIKLWKSCYWKLPGWTPLPFSRQPELMVS